jgi:AbrB family looped-hinge helix DNA binding protein
MNRAGGKLFPTQLPHPTSPSAACRPDTAVCASFPHTLASACAHGVFSLAWRKVWCAPQRAATGEKEPLRSAGKARAMIKTKVTAEGRMSLPADIRKRHGLAQGGEVLVEDTGDAIVLRTLDQVVARAQALSRRLVADRPGASVDDFLAERRHEADTE